MNPARFAGRIPCSVHWAGGRAVVDWCHVGEHPFHEPFFEDSVQRALRHPFNMLFRESTPVERLGEWCVLRRGLPPTGFIFHLSRCGSTLVSQLLKTVRQHLVISEAPPIDAILRGGSAIDDDQRIEWLHWMVSALGQPRRSETRYFIKFDSWHALNLPLIRRAFPDVPWIFVERSTDEIVASHLKQPGAQMIPQLMPPELFGIERGAALQMSREEYMHQVIAVVREAGRNAVKEFGGLLIDYRDLPAAVWSSLPAYWNFELDDQERAEMMAAARFESKTRFPYASAAATSASPPGFCAESSHTA